jgi:hypothetical protein
MPWRKQELARFSNALSWLPQEQARPAFERANAGTARDRYGLDECVWEILDHWDVEKIGLSATRIKLAQHALDEAFLLFFSRDDICRVPRGLFLDEWQNMFGPSRDDVIVMPEAGAWCLFYCHEDEFEAGRRKEPNSERSASQQPPLDAG